MRNAAIFYAVWYWLDRFLVADPSAIASRWPFALGLTIVLLALTFWIFSRPKTQQFFSGFES
jgi:cbb3-type cytochrome oxidase subunit 3